MWILRSLGRIDFKTCENKLNAKGFVSQKSYKIAPGNRVYQKEICRSFDEISETVLLPTQTTQELIELNQYVQKTEDVVFKELETKLLEAEKNVLFLLE